jgi:hypothetical protein
MVSGFASAHFADASTTCVEGTWVRGAVSGRVVALSAAVVAVTAVGRSSNTHAFLLSRTAKRNRTSQFQQGSAHIHRWSVSYPRACRGGRRVARMHDTGHGASAATATDGEANRSVRATADWLVSAAARRPGPAGQRRVWSVRVRDAVGRLLSRVDTFARRVHTCVSSARNGCSAGLCDCSLTWSMRGCRL